MGLFRSHSLVLTMLPFLCLSVPCPAPLSTIGQSSALTLLSVPPLMGENTRVYARMYARNAYPTEETCVLPHCPRFNARHTVEGVNRLMEAKETHECATHNLCISPPHRNLPAVNPCEENEGRGPCSHLCLISYNRTASCTCPHLMKLAPDKQSCFGE